MRVEHDRHVLGVFPRSDWLRWLTEAGFQAGAMPVEHSEVEDERDVFLGRRPRA